MPTLTTPGVGLKQVKVKSAIRAGPERSIIAKIADRSRRLAVARTLMTRRYVGINRPSNVLCPAAAQECRRAPKRKNSPVPSQDSPRKRHLHILPRWLKVQAAVRKRGERLS